MNIGTRKEIKKDIKKGYVSVDKIIIYDASFSVSNKSTILYKNKEIFYEQYQYFILNKPSGYVSTTFDKKKKTVTSLLHGARKDIFPIGRLDIDTEGLLLLSNDGEMAHHLLSPKKHVKKTYFAKVLGDIKESDIQKFREGFYYDLNLKSLPSDLSVISKEDINDSIFSNVNITICEGKFHQIKKMFKTLGYSVVFLKRIGFGPLTLPNNLPLGEYRRLTKDEIMMLKNIK